MNASLNALLHLRWDQANGLRIPSCALMALDDLSLYAIVPLEQSEPRWDRAIIFTDWERAKGLFVFRANSYLRTIAENGKVAYLESGRDCDCVEYSGRVHVVDATWEAFEELEAGISEWADGPFRLSLARVSETRAVRYESRDLVLEAMENGHPHSIVSQFP